MADVDLQNSKLDEGLTAPSSGSQDIRHADGLIKKNTDYQIPFVKASPFWSSIEEMDVLKEFPQQPHFLPLQKCLPGTREGTAIGLMVQFNDLVKDIRKLSIEGNESLFEEKKAILDDLKTYGFEFQYLETFLDDAIKVKIEYTKHLEEEGAVQADMVQAKSSVEQKDLLLRGGDDSMIELEVEISDLRNKLDDRCKKLDDIRENGKLIEKEKEVDQQKVSSLIQDESRVKEALDADKRQFDSILASIVTNSCWTVF